MTTVRRIALTTPSDLQGEIARFATTSLSAAAEATVDLALIRVTHIPSSEVRALAGTFAGVTLLINEATREALCAGSAAALGSLAEAVRKAAPSVATALERALLPPDRSPLRCGDLTLPIGGKTYMMGIINMTIDSFSGDGLANDIESAVEQGRRFVEDGADILDIGGESARADVPVEAENDEIARVVPVIRRLRQETKAVISIDTYKERVAMAAVEAGAHIVNDIGGFKLGMGTATVATKTGAALVLNYTYERPKIRPSSPPRYKDVIGETIRFLQERIDMAMDAGVAFEQLSVDPGIAFGKSHDEDIEALRRLPELAVLGRPILVAASRKHFIGAVLGLPSEDRVEGTAAVVSLSIAGGADIVRVHDVKHMARVAKMSDAIARGRLGDFASTDHSWPWPANVTPLS